MAEKEKKPITVTLKVTLPTKEAIASAIQRLFPFSDLCNFEVSIEGTKIEENIFKSLLPNKMAETERRNKIMPLLIEEYQKPNSPRNIGYFIRKYDIPQSTIYYHFKKNGISRKEAKIPESTRDEG